MKDAIQMVDLKNQYKRIQPEIDEAVASVMADAAYINGPQVREFTEALKTFNNVNSVITCANGTDALQIAMMALGLKPGDEVIVPAFTYVATVEVIALLGLVPKFVDVRIDTFELDHSQLSNVVSDKTVGIVPVHLFGQCSNMERIQAFAEQHNIAVIEDTAQAIGAQYIFENGASAFAGTVGKIGTTSFFPSKNLGCFGDGGALFTQDVELGNKLNIIANHGQRKKYHHEVIGINSRLDTIQAAILNVKIKYLGQYISARQQVAAEYDRKLSDLPGLTIPVRAPYSTHVFNQYTCRVLGGKRDALKRYLQERGVPTMVYYPIPVHLQAAYSIYGYQRGDFPIAESLCEEVISLPIHTEMSAETQQYIIDQIINFFNND